MEKAGGTRSIVFDEIRIPHLKFPLLVAHYVLGNLSYRHLPAMAQLAVLDGMESASLLILAGMAEADSSEISYYWDKSLQELQIPLPEKRAAALALALYYCYEIAEGKLDPVAGTKSILDTCLHRYDFHSETPKYAFDSIGFEAAYGVFDSYEEWEAAGFTHPGSTKSPESLQQEIKDLLVEEIKGWVASQKD